jgi:methyl coenzyme M reductase alpha subunit
MQLEISQEAIQAAIQAHLDETVKRGIDYKVTNALNNAIAAAITPEVVSGYVDAAMKAITDPAITQRIVTEMQAAIAEGVRLTMQEAIVGVACRLRPQSRNTEEQARMDAVRERLFPSPNA